MNAKTNKQTIDLMGHAAQYGSWLMNNLNELNFTRSMLHTFMGVHPKAGILKRKRKKERNRRDIENSTNTKSRTPEIRFKKRTIHVSNGKSFLSTK